MREDLIKLEKELARIDMWYAIQMAVLVFFSILIIGLLAGVA